jgi:uncharacterized membrane protein YesL
MEPKENGLMAVLNKMAGCLIVNACWIVGCLPVFTIGASTTAMCAAIQRNILYDNGYPFGTFWKEYKRNFKAATLIWLPELLAGGLLCYDISWLYQQAAEGHAWGLLYLLLAVVLVLLILTALYCCCYVAKFETTRWKAFRSSFLIMLMHPFRNLLFLVLGVGMVILILAQVWLLLFLPVFYVLSFTQFADKVFYELMTEEEQAKEDERHRNYAAEERQKEQ